MVGDGDLRQKCETYVQTHQLPVQFAGFLNQLEIIEAYVAADCLVLPSDAGETWGLVVNEAMACGLPAIVSDEVGCHRDLIQPDVTGWCYPQGNIPQLADRLSALASHARPHIQQIGQQAKTLVENTYNYSEVVKGMMEALQIVT